jgi:peptidoglycan/xylan/chitin deacetylase (PgdA/CDA1 family)
MRRVPGLGMRKTRSFVFAAAFAAVSGWCGVAAAEPANLCPGHPGALGTSRTLAVSFDEFQRLGTMQYKETLPLADHEVAITFDDGPMRLLSDKALDILNSQCVKVTYFIIGEMAHYFPDIVRREYASGNTIGTHSYDHPLRFDRISDDKVRWEIDQGIAAVGAALGDPAELAPFFRIPGLGRTKVVEAELAKRRLIVFSADVVADDWFRHITPQQIIQRAMRRLERHGRGILLLHDIHPATVLALPGLLKELKDNGFHVVHVVPAGPVVASRPSAVAVAAAQGSLEAAGAPPNWPEINVSLTADDIKLAAPDIAAFEVNYPFQPDNGVAEADDGSQWPTRPEPEVSAADAELPAPGLADIGVTLSGKELVGTTLASRPSVEVPAAKSGGTEPNARETAAKTHVAKVRGAGRFRRHFARTREAARIHRHSARSHEATARSRESVGHVHLHAHRPIRARFNLRHEHAEIDADKRSQTAALAPPPKATQRSFGAY